MARRKLLNKELIREKNLSLDTVIIYAELQSKLRDGTGIEGLTNYINHNNSDTEFLRGQIELIESGILVFKNNEWYINDQER